MKILSVILLVAIASPLLAQRATDAQLNLSASVSVAVRVCKAHPEAEVWLYHGHR